MTYRRIHEEEEYAGDRNFGLRVEVTLDRELTKDERLVVQRAAREIKEALLTTEIARDPIEQERATREREALIGAFGGMAIYVEEIPNGYSDEYDLRHLPWFRVTTRKGPIEVGWRKRVISISWAQSVADDARSMELFPGRISLGDRQLPAASYDRLKEVIEVLMR